MLLSNILQPNSNNELKIASIGQSIMQASRPRALMAPLQVSLGIQLHQQFASRFLIDTLNSMGFSSSYSEIKRYQSCAAVEQVNHNLDVKEATSLQFIADYVDHNSCTIDGHGTFHGMGIIARLTPGSKCDRLIPRAEISKESLLALGSIEVKYFRRPLQLNNKQFQELRQLDTTDEFWTADLLCNIIWPLRSPRIPWSGFMQMYREGQHPGKSSTVFFPMIDLPPSDMSCVFSTLHFICREAAKYRKTPIITFEQPLYWKAHQIISNETEGSELKNSVLRLGGFHLETSFLGAIGHLMSGSGLQEVLETVYDPNAVLHMLCGKAVSRAIRGHNLVASSLNAILLASTYGLNTEPFQSNSMNGNPNEMDECNLDTNDDQNVDPSLAVHQESLTTDTYPQYNDSQDPPSEVITQNPLDPELEEACLLYDRLLAGEVTLKDVTNSKVFRDIYDKITALKSSLIKKRTAKLWIIYLDMKHLQKFLEAERTGNWRLHLHTIKMMLPYLAAAGHNLYVKSAYVYLCEMQELAQSHPDVYAMFETGHHVLRRSNRYWAGLSSDVVIEQVLMRSMKTSGGLTRGRGMTEFQSVQWLLSSPVCAEINHSMQNLTGIDYHSSEQHKGTGKTRQSHDNRDAFTILRHIKDRNSFEGDVHLRSIETGMMPKKK